MARVRLLTPNDVPDEHRGFVQDMEARGGFINLYQAMAHSPVALRRFYELLLCLWTGVVSGRSREAAILSVVAASNAPYPLGWHLLDGEEAGLTVDEMRAIIDGDYAALSTRDASIARFARSLTLDARVPEAEYAAVAKFMDAREIVEVTLIAGLYRLVAGFTNALAVDLDDEPARRLALL